MAVLQHRGAFFEWFNSKRPLIFRLNVREKCLLSQR